MEKAKRNLGRYFRGIINTIFLLFSLILLADMIKPLKTIIRAFFTTFLNLQWFFILCGYYKTFHNYIAYSWWLLFISYTTYWLIKTQIIPRFYKIKWKKQLLRTGGNPTDQLERELFRYVTGSERICFLVYGSWGVGKTRTVNRFIEDLHKANLCPVHSISCFGLSSREALVAEIKRVCEANDTSIRKRFLEILHGIPVIGDLLHSILKKDYDIPNIPRNTVFIFDDFERISTHVFNEKSYRPRNSSSGSGFKEINDVSREVAKGFKEFTLRDNAIVATQYVEKISIIVGFINDIVENYNLKVIILANTEMIPYFVLRDTLESKLACRKFHILLTDERIVSTIYCQLSRNLMLDKPKKQMVHDYIEQNMEFILAAWSASGITNLRVMNSLIYSFCLAIEQNSLQLLKENLNNLFFSLLISHFEYELGNSDPLWLIQPGENPLAFTAKRKYYAYNKPQLSMKYMNEYPRKTELRWFGKDIALSFLIGDFNINISNELLKAILLFDNNYGISILIGERDKEVIHNIDDFIIDIWYSEHNAIDYAFYIQLLRDNRIDFHLFSLALNDLEISPYKFESIIKMIPYDARTKHERLEKEFIKQLVLKLEHEYPYMIAYYGQERHYSYLLQDINI